MTNISPIVGGTVSFTAKTGYLTSHKDHAKLLFNLFKGQKLTRFPHQSHMLELYWPFWHNLDFFGAFKDPLDAGKHALTLFLIHFLIFSQSWSSTCADKELSQVCNIVIWQKLAGNAKNVAQNFFIRKNNAVSECFYHLLSAKPAGSNIPFSFWYSLRIVSKVDFFYKLLLLQFMYFLKIIS